jgi:hypothetical protein
MTMLAIARKQVINVAISFLAALAVLVDRLNGHCNSDRQILYVKMTIAF